MLNPSDYRKRKKVQQLRGKIAILRKRVAALETGYDHAEQQHFEWQEKTDRLGGAMLGISGETPAGSRIPEKKEAKLLPRYRRASQQALKWEKQRDFLGEKITGLEQQIDEIDGQIETIETGEENTVSKKRPAK